eukprot:TRINITY_DN23521_c0_g2_i1.p1 TRINITY_DN23521_c0_g2~~TRINITY_DN23521_c0_g2_i1.p1  ORF type:complete len:139 (-),score=8.44 TRINITY_DN23521_c0_g2_i1:84-500(-)
MTNTRREFIEQSAATMAATATAAWLYSSESNADDNLKKDADRMAVAVIGPGGMGMSHVQLLSTNPAVRVAAICEVDDVRAAKAADAVTKGAGMAPKVVKDMRQVLDDPEIKAVWIATPDHWHAPAAILAANAGKQKKK